MELGVWKALNKRKCGLHYSCKSVAEYYIGDKNKPQDPHNYYLCHEHLELIFKSLANKYNVNVEPQNGALNEQNSEGGTNTQSTIKDYLNALYDNNGVISKAKMIELCQKHEIEIPEETPTMKALMEMLFKDELKISHSKEETDV